MRRFRREREPHAAVPQWAPFFDGDSLHAFMVAIQKDLSRRRFGYDLRADEGSVRFKGPTMEEHVAWLSNLAQQCSVIPRHAWRELIERHFDVTVRSLTSASSTEHLGDDFDEAREMLRVRLYPSDVANSDVMVSRAPAEGLLAVLALDLPETIRMVDPDQVSLWSRPLDELFAIGLANVRKEGHIEPDVVTLEDETPLMLLVGNSLFTATRALMLEDYLDPEAEFGALVAVPRWDIVSYHPIVDTRFNTALAQMIPATRGMFAEGPRPISPDVYWWHQRRLTRLPAVISDMTIHFRPPDEFVHHVIHRLP